MRITLEPVAFDTATPAELDAWHTVRQAAESVDFPGEPPLSRADTVGDLVPGQDDRPAWIARCDGDAVGVGLLVLHGRENAHFGEALCWVRPDVRRRGVGRTLFDRLRAVAVEDGRTALSAYTPKFGGGGPFARAVGMTPDLVEIRSRLHVGEVDLAAITRYAAGSESRTDGYDLVGWVDHCPAELLDAYAVAVGGMNDAPQGGLDWNKVTADGPRVRAREEASVRRGYRRHVLCVRERATGVLAGMTMVFVADDTTRANQGDTAVLASFRGRGFGLWLKAAMLLRLATEEPHVTCYDTFNAAENAHMLAVNRRLGYRQVDTWQAWQLRLS